MAANSLSELTKTERPPRQPGHGGASLTWRQQMDTFSRLNSSFHSDKTFDTSSFVALTFLAWHCALRLTKPKRLKTRQTGCRTFVEAHKSKLLTPRTSFKDCN